MKKFKLIVGAVALFALVVANVWNAATTLRSSDLNIADVEAMANPEGMEGHKVRGKEVRKSCYLTYRVNLYQCGVEAIEGNVHCCRAGSPLCHITHSFTEVIQGTEIDCEYDEKKYCKRLPCCILR